MAGSKALDCWQNPNLITEKSNELKTSNKGKLNLSTASVGPLHVVS